MKLGTLEFLTVCIPKLCALEFLAVGTVELGTLKFLAVGIEKLSALEFLTVGTVKFGTLEFLTVGIPMLGASEFDNRHREARRHGVSLACRHPGFEARVAGTEAPQVDEVL